MLFADDAAVATHTQEEPQSLVDCFSQACKDFGTDHQSEEDESPETVHRSTAGHYLRLLLTRTFELSQITGAAFIDLTAAYDTINHRRLLVKLLMLTDDVPLTKFIRTMLSNRRFKVELNGKQSRWRNQRNGLPQGSVLSPLLFNVYTNDQPLPAATNSFIYADDLCLTTQQKTFEQVETTLASGLNELGAYYNENHLRPNPAKTQLTAFHLKNHQADRKLNVTWNGTKLEHTHSPVYLGITLDRSLTYRNHCLKTRAKL